MKSVLWATQVYPRHEDDPFGRFLHLLARELPSRGVRVRVIAPGADDAPPRQELDGVEITRFTYGPSGTQTLAYSGEMHREALRFPVRFVTFVRRFRAAIAEAIRTENPAVLHAHWWAPTGWIAAKESGGVPLVLSLHGTDVRLAMKVPFVTPLARGVFARAALVLPVSSAIMRDVDRLGLPMAASELLPMPADDRVFHPPEARSGSIRFVLAARLTAQKRGAAAIVGLADVVSRGIDAYLDVAGDGPERDAMERIAREASVEERVTFHGMVAPGRLAELFRRARAVVLPSVGEGYGLTLVEGALCSTPGIGARSGGIEDLLIPEETGLLFEPDDLGGLADAMARLATDPALAERLGENARSRARERTAGPLAERLLGLYRSLARA